MQIKGLKLSEEDRGELVRIVKKERARVWVKGCKRCYFLCDLGSKGPRNVPRTAFG